MHALCRSFFVIATLTLAQAAHADTVFFTDVGATGYGESCIRLVNTVLKNTGTTGSSCDGTLNNYATVPFSFIPVYTEGAWYTFSVVLNVARSNVQSRCTVSLYAHDGLGEKVRIGPVTVDAASGTRSVTIGTVQLTPAQGIRSALVNCRLNAQTSLSSVTVVHAGP